MLGEMTFGIQMFGRMTFRIQMFGVMIFGINLLILRFTVALPLIFPCVIMIIFCSNYLTEGAHSLYARWLLLGFLAMRVKVIRFYLICIIFGKQNNKQ